MKQSRIYAVIGVSAVALAGVAVTMQAANAAHGTVAMSHHGITANHMNPMKKGNCYSNYRNDSGNGVVSQNFSDAGFDIYDSNAADSFTVKKTCKVTGINAAGQYFNGTGPADSETVTFYTDNGGVPGDAINSQTVTGTDSGGSFVVPLSSVAIPPGAAWVSVAANMSFAAGGEWGWEVSTHQKQGTDGMWENPGGGFGVCPTWDTIDNCVGVSGDFMFTLTK